jgi:predicted HTH transcriptional regulator
MNVYPEELERLIRQGESQEVEFKSSTPTPQEIAKHVAAFANTNGGALVLGVKEPGEIVGVDEQRARGAIEMARQYLSPVPEMKVQSPNIHGQVVVVVQVAASDELHSAMGGYFGRGARPSEVLEKHRADAVRPLTSTEIRLHALKGKSEDAALSRLAKAVADQTRATEKQTETIDKLNLDLAKANAPWIKIAVALAGVIAGAVLVYFIEQGWK